MADLPIKPYVDPVRNDRVYGVLMKDYEVDGSRTDYSAALALASLQQSEAIESLLPALNNVIDVRQRKVSDLGEVLATLAEALASMDPKDGATDKKSNIDSAKLTNANDLLKKYGYATFETHDGQITYADASRVQNDIQQAMDEESNDLQQNMTLLQSFVQKRDNSFEVANKVLSKANRTASDTISSIGY